MINMFWDLHYIRKPSTSIEPFDPVRIETHLKLSGNIIKPWEYTVIMDMDLMYRATIIGNRG